VSDTNTCRWYIAFMCSEWCYGLSRLIRQESSLDLATLKPNLSHISKLILGWSVLNWIEERIRKITQLIRNVSVFIYSRELHCFYQLPAGSTAKYSYIVECVFWSNHNSGLVSYTELTLYTRKIDWFRSWNFTLLHFLFAGVY